MALEDQMLIVMYIMLGAVAAMLYALRRIFMLEKKILSLETVILRLEESLVGRKRRSNFIFYFNFFIKYSIG